MLERVSADQRILAGAAATLSWQPTDSDGEPAAPDGVVTVGVTRADGTALIAPGTATSGATDNPRTVALTSAQTSTLDWLLATWTDAGGGTATTIHEVVGGFYFTLAELRNAQPDLADASKYPPEALLAARWQVEDEFEDIAGVAFVPRYRRARVLGHGTQTLILPDPLVRTVRSVWAYSTATAYTVFTADQLAALAPYAGGYITDGNGIAFSCGFDHVVAYEHGHDRPPADLQRLAMVRAREVANESKTTIPARAERYTSPEGTLVFSLLPGGPGGRRTGNPDIDAALTRYGWDPPPFAA